MDMKYKIGDELVLKDSREVGEVVGRADYKDHKDQYLLRYVSAQGVLVEQWWPESALAEASRELDQV